jgi:hypothetical protein
MGPLSGQTVEYTHTFIFDFISVSLCLKELEFTLTPPL